MHLATFSHPYLHVKTPILWEVPLFIGFFGFITDNRIVDGKAKIIGHYEKVEAPSESLLKRLRENGMSFKTQQQLFSA